MVGTDRRETYRTIGIRRRAELANQTRCQIVPLREVVRPPFLLRTTRTRRRRPIWSITAMMGVLPLLQGSVVSSSVCLRQTRPEVGFSAVSLSLWQMICRISRLRVAGRPRSSRMSRLRRVSAWRNRRRTGLVRRRLTLCSFRWLGFCAYKSILARGSPSWRVFFASILCRDSGASSRRRCRRRGVHEEFRERFGDLVLVK